MMEAEKKQRTLPWIFPFLPKSPNLIKRVQVDELMQESLPQILSEGGRIETESRGGRKGTGRAGATQGGTAPARKGTCCSGGRGQLPGAEAAKCGEAFRNKAGAVVLHQASPSSATSLPADRTAAVPPRRSLCHSAQIASCLL